MAAPKITCHICARNSRLGQAITSTQKTSAHRLSCLRAVPKHGGDKPDKDEVGARYCDTYNRHQHAGTLLAVVIEAAL